MGLVPRLVLCSAPLLWPAGPWAVAVAGLALLTSCRYGGSAPLGGSAALWGVPEARGCPFPLLVAFCADVLTLCALYHFGTAISGAEVVADVA